MTTKKLENWQYVDTDKLESWTFNQNLRPYSDLLLTVTRDKKTNRWGYSVSVLVEECHTFKGSEHDAQEVQGVAFRASQLALQECVDMVSHLIKQVENHDP